MRFLVGDDEPCMFCGETPKSGGWGRPCPSGDDEVHWTVDQWRDGQDEKLAAVARSLSRAAYELEQSARRIDGLSPRLQRKILRASKDLSPDQLRNEAERARDTLHVYRLLDL